jgi:hypothetical protein
LEAIAVENRQSIMRKCARIPVGAEIRVFDAVGAIVERIAAT